MKKIGILGGTFNPFHNGHLKMAVEAYVELKLDELLIIPSGFSYMKSDETIADPMHRLKMAKIAVKKYPNINVSDIEIRREGPTYTCETIKQLRETYPDAEFYFIIGADTLFTMENWKNPRYIFKEVIIAVKQRDHIDGKNIIRQAEYLTDKYKARIIPLPGKKVWVSSNIIRYSVETNDSIRPFVPENIARYIKRHGLYKNEKLDS